MAGSEPRRRTATCCCAEAVAVPTDLGGGLEEGEEREYCGLVLVLV